MNVAENTMFKTNIDKTDYYGMYNYTEGFYLIVTYPINEAMFSRNIAVCILTFMEIIVFAGLFMHIYFLIKKLIVNNIHRINETLSVITGGDLNVQVNVRDTDEFTSLSYDINRTVDALKHYIDEAETIKIILEDNGAAFNPLNTPDPDVNLSYDERKIGGLGIYMVKKIASSVVYDWINETNVLTVTFKKEEKM